MNLVIIQAIGDLKYVSALKLDASSTRIFYYDHLDIENEIRSLLPDYHLFKINYPKKIKYYSLNELDRLRVELITTVRYLEVFRVFYFSNYFDFATRIVLEYLVKNGVDVFFVDEDHEHLKNMKPSFTLNSVLMRFWIRSIRGTRVIRFGSRDIFEFKPFWNANTLRVKSNISKLNVNYCRKTVIFLEENWEADNIFSNYQEELKSVLDLILIAGFQLLLKPHPRIGLSNLNCLQDFEEFHSKLPLEFFKFGSNVTIFGFYSTAFRQLESDNTPISLFQLFSCRLRHDKEQRLAYLKGYNLHLPESMKELNDLLYVV